MGEHREHHDTLVERVAKTLAAEVDSAYSGDGWMRDDCARDAFRREARAVIQAVVDDPECPPEFSDWLLNQLATPTKEEMRRDLANYVDEYTV